MSAPAPATVDTEQTPDQQIEHLAGENLRAAAQIRQLTDQNVEYQITIQVLKDQLAEQTKAVTDTRVFASKLNMELDTYKQLVNGGNTPPNAPGMPVPGSKPPRTTKGALKAGTAKPKG